ncbi:pseudouridylate synthase 1 homolog isoform X2 [Pyxicephalus adspersus]|uniref:pseudouridylate synthase 1 homolog isoform X2 n=1 Tax=Pyxicephalus adspersus TaxID=30357 RepID=UPI003B59BFC9
MFWVKMGRISILGVHSRSFYKNIFLRSISIPSQIPIATDHEKFYNPTSNKEKLNEENVLKVVKPLKQKKKKFAILMAYCGFGYHGMQVNISGLPSIEGALISALIKAQCIPDISFSNLKEIQFQRCSRTDKGVSALAQVISVYLFSSCTDSMEKINSYLPPEIRVLGIKRATNGFNSRNMCHSRTYSYTLPTFALSRSGGTAPDSSFRLPREDFHLVNRLLSFYKGSHNFHNFTNSILPTDKSARRYIIDIHCTEPFVQSGVEFTRILIKGHSFMLHQIRKMVCLVIAVARGLASPDLLPYSVQMDKVNIPLAPGLGLVLEFTHFDSYNLRYHESPLHDPITWEEFLPAREAIREERIMPVIIKGEINDLSMCLWLQRLSIHNFMNVKKN